MEPYSLSKAPPKIALLLPAPPKARPPPKKADPWFPNIGKERE